MMKFIRHDRQYSTSIYIQYNAQEKVIEKTYAKNGKDKLTARRYMLLPVRVFVCLSHVRISQKRLKLGL